MKLSKNLYRITVFVLLLAVTVLCTDIKPLNTQAALTPVPEGKYKFQNVSSGKYLNAFANNGADVNGTNVCASTGDGSDQQIFQVSFLERDLSGMPKYTLSPKSSTAGRLVDIYTTGSVTDGANVQLWSATSYPSKHWYFDNISGDIYVIRSVLNSNYVLAAVSNDHRANVVVKQYNSSSTLQQWKMQSVSSAYPSTYYWKLPWKSTKQAKFMGGYGQKADGSKMDAHFTTRYNQAKDSATVTAYMKSLAIDFSTSEANFEIYAPTSGTVTTVSYDSGGYGNYMRMTTSDGYDVILAHLRDRPLVNVGNTVSAGQKIGYMGNTGNSSGQHLHFEIRDALPNIKSKSDYTPITYLFGKPIRTWAYYFSSENGGNYIWYSGQV